MPCPVGLDELIDYLAGELEEARAQDLEAHLFECPTCATPFEALETLRATVADAVRCAEVGGNVGSTFLEKAARDGLTLREYRIPEGDSVACSAGPEDLVVVRLAADYAGLEKLRLDVDFEDLEQRATVPLPARDVVVDRRLDEVVLVFPGALVRTYPRSRWTLRLQGEGAAGPAEIGPFVMDHTP